MSVVFIENDDSFSWNVIDLLPVSREHLAIHRGSSGIRWEGVRALVIGPGPTDPVRAGLLDVVHLAVEKRVPVLGVCLGHQAIGLAFGAQLVRSTPSHGKRARATFSKSRCFSTIEGPQQVMRYHSLSLTQVPLPLRVVATLDDGTVMAVEHETLPIAGLQFHPDSFATPSGRAMVESFFGSLA